MIAFFSGPDRVSEQLPASIFGPNYPSRKVATEVADLLDLSMGSILPEVVTDHGVILFGTSGTGKTHLMKMLFDAVMEKARTAEVVRVRAQALQIEAPLKGSSALLKDLLPSSSPPAHISGKPRLLAGEGKFQWCDFHTPSKFWSLIANRRTTAKTINNASSSRSHQAIKLEMGGRTVMLLDLAGSEPFTGSSCTRLGAQTNMIHGTLKNVEALVHNLGRREGRVSGRDDHLTRLMCHLLTKGKCIVIGTIRGSSDQETQTLDTVKFVSGELEFEETGLLPRYWTVVPTFCKDETAK
ncbi:hypothetical protein CALVIDRAFT_531694 [Calocera viscosa TUFC12733]|uniref:Kinesin motor domain-containing protein n=1 Tax=Calocera viscosa (strain TUFC12733) TaxID=1330018 RepID=A0A167G016_CALVF|nr:hypothetical protein CALVIDRAFT_531694 [Calocera viscosa TUFC12733]